MSAPHSRQTSPPKIREQPGLRVELGVDEPLRLECGVALGPFTVAYQTYGALNDEKSNAILVCHALSGDQFLAGVHPVTGKKGWWDVVVGPGKPLDTDRYFVIGANLLGACMGTAGPKETNPATGRPYGLDFPVITVGDMVKAQKLLIDHLGIDQLFCVTGGSMGGMLVLDWAVRFPERVFSAVPIATAARTSAQNIAFHEVGRQAVMTDPDWCGGDYLSQGKTPHRGLAVARMGAHITYLSETALHRKFGRNLQDRQGFTYGFEADFQVESYLRHQGITFVDRFDANTYLYITRAMDYFDLAEEHGGVLAEAFRGTKVRFCVISFTSDWMFPTSENREIVHALNAAAANVSFVEIETDQGHDSFLLDIPDYQRTLTGFLDGAAEHRGLVRPGPAAPINKTEDESLAGAPAGAAPKIRADLQLVADLVEPGSRVLDVGCGDGTLLYYLSHFKEVDGRGLEISQAGVNACVSQGLSVIQGDAETDLKDYPSQAFDYVILSQTLQAIHAPREVLAELLRIGQRAIVSITNIGYWRLRRQLLLRGRMPVTDPAGHQWYDTPNIHLSTIKDFVTLCGQLGITIERCHSVARSGKTREVRPSSGYANLLGQQAVFLLG